MSNELTLDQQLAIRTSVERLHEEFADHYNAATIEPRVPAPGPAVPASPRRPQFTSPT